MPKGKAVVRTVALLRLKCSVFPTPALVHIGLPLPGLAPAHLVILELRESGAGAASLSPARAACKLGESLFKTKHEVGGVHQYGSPGFSPSGWKANLTENLNCFSAKTWFV